MTLPVSTLPFTAEAVRKVTHFSYDYHYYFTVISIHSSMVNELRGNLKKLFYSIVLYKLLFNNVCKMSW